MENPIIAAFWAGADVYDAAADADEDQREAATDELMDLRDNMADLEGERQCYEAMEDIKAAEYSGDRFLVDEADAERKQLYGGAY